LRACTAEGLAAAQRRPSRDPCRAACAAAAWPCWFVLLERTPPEEAGRPWELAPFRRWVNLGSPAPAAWSTTARCAALHEPSDYRVEVRFRWYDARGQLARTAIRHSPACRPA
jgi:hypothetical protein